MVTKGLLSVNVNHGADQTFDITPDPNCHVADVLVDGVSVGTLPNYSFINVTRDHIIAATFAINTHLITVSAGANGAITPVDAGPEPIPHPGVFTISTIANPILGKKLSHCYQLTVDGKEYLIANYVKFSITPCNPMLAVWNLTDKTEGLIPVTGAEGGEDYPPIFSTDLLSNGHLALVNRMHYIEYDLLNRAVAFQHALDAAVDTDNSVQQGLTGHVLMSQGNNINNMWLNWCDPGGSNWDGVQISGVPANVVYIRMPCSMKATDGYNYAYIWHNGNNNYVRSIRMDTKAQQDIPFVGSIVNLYQVAGAINKVYAYVKNGSTWLWYALDGISEPKVVDTPSVDIRYHIKNETGSIQNHWFVSSVIPVDKANIMPNDTGIVSINHSGADRPISGVATDALWPKLFSPPNPDGYSLIQGGDYGPVYKQSPTEDRPTFLGYDNRNAYFDYYSKKHKCWFRVGYDRKFSKYLPGSPWTCGLLSNATEILTANPTYKVVTPSSLAPTNTDDHFLFPCEGIDGKIYFSVRSRPRMLWYDPDADTWGALVLTDQGIFDADIMHIKTIMGGLAIAISSRDQDIVGGNWVGRLRVFDVLSQTITKVLTITAPDSNPALVDIGILVEADPGHVIAVRGNLASASRAWRINTNAIMPAAIVWEQAITGNAFNLNITGTNEYCDLEIGPDGLIYLMVGTALKTLNPADGTIATVTPDSGSLPSGCRLRWVGNDLYGYYADKNLYKVTGLVN